MNIQRENGIDEVNCAFRMLNMSLDQFIEIQHSMVSLDLDFEVNEEHRNTKKMSIQLFSFVKNSI